MGKSVRELKQERNKRRKQLVKDELAIYGANLALIEALEDEIIKKRDCIDGVRSGLGNTDPSKGVGSSQEDKIIKVLDEIKEIEKEIDHTKEEVRSMRKAIKMIDDPQLEAIIYQKWIYGSESIRSLATKYGVSHNAVWKKSDVALLKLYKILRLSGYKVDKIKLNDMI
nr:MAG TPA: Protein of unknown function (DUF722) [Caudoviricetes sp.]